MADAPTCGQGLAHNAALPAKLADVIDAVADNLVVHMTALDPADHAAAQELAAYTSLAERHRAIAADLRATADEMEGYRDLPTAPHDETVMSSPEVAAAFAGLVRVEAELAELLRARAREWEEMLPGDA